MRWDQIQFLSRNESGDLVGRQSHQRKIIDNLRDDINNLMDSRLLHPSEYGELVKLKDKLHIESVQLQLYQEELSQFTRQEINKPIAALLVTGQPFPKSIRQNKTIESEVEVTLLTGARQEIVVREPCVAKIVSYNTTRGNKKHPVVVQNNSKPVDNNVAIFNVLIALI